MSAAYRFPPNFNPQQPIPGATAPVNMASQRFCLRWNNHQSNLLSVFDQLLQSESFVDVTLAVEGKLLKAHKMVLSACSPYFQSLFVSHPDKHPIVILKDVPYSDMKSLLDFMYRGEVSVDQDRLTHFLRVAECLRIKGLTEVNEEKCDNIANSLSNQNSQVPNLQRINQQNKRFAPQQQQFGNMLGNYLMSQPKRKRGRPRRLSGNETDETDGKESVIHGSPEMLEVKMGMDGFAGNSDESTGGEGDDGRIRDEDEDGLPGTSQSEKYRESRTDEEIRADSMTPQQLLTPKVEVDENFETHDNNLEATPESSRISTPDSLIHHNNNNMSTPSTSGALGGNSMSAPQNKPAPKRRMRRRANSQSQDPAEQLTEMSVRGLNLFRYAAINEGVYQCTECAKVDITKTFKNKYSFQRHAFLYHEGQQRKVFPCPVCSKEFSRPDKMKNHMKTVHDCFMPKVDPADVVFPQFPSFLPQLQQIQQIQQLQAQAQAGLQGPPII